MKLASQSRGRGQKPTCVSCLPGKVHAAANTKFVQILGISEIISLLINYISVKYW